MRNLIVLLFISWCIALGAQPLELPRVDLPTVELPRVELPRVDLPGTPPINLHDGGQVQESTGLPAGHWRRTGFGGRIQLYDPSGMPGIELDRSATGSWLPVFPSESGTWIMDPGGILRLRNY